MTKKSDRKLPPRLGPLRDSVQRLEQFRAHPAYAEGAFIDDAAEAAFLVAAARIGQRRRRTVPRHTQAVVHELVSAQVAAVDTSPTYPVLQDDPYVQLTEAFQRLASEEQQIGVIT